MRMLMSKKNIVIFTYKHSVFSLDMKTKVVQHVPVININTLTYDSMTAWHDRMKNNHKQWLLSIDLKTKVVQHVPTAAWLEATVTKLGAAEYFTFWALPLRERLSPAWWEWEVFPAGQHHTCTRLHSHQGGDSLSLTRQSPQCEKNAPNLVTVSYTHLTLPTICSV